MSGGGGGGEAAGPHRERRAHTGSAEPAPGAPSSILCVGPDASRRMRGEKAEDGSRRALSDIRR